MATPLYRTLSPINIISKYAYDVNIFVPVQYCDVALTGFITAEFENIQHWSTCNKMTINLSMTKEILCRCPFPLHYNFVPCIDGVVLVNHVNIMHKQWFLYYIAVLLPMSVFVFYIFKTFERLNDDV